MILNDNIPNEINQWHINFDHNKFFINENWLKHAYPTEDILQLSHVYEGGYIIDVGFYGEIFKIYIISDKDWDNPKEIFESSDPETVTEKVYEFIIKYADGHKNNIQHHNNT